MQQRSFLCQPGRTQLERPVVRSDQITGDNLKLRKQPLLNVGGYHSLAAIFAAERRFILDIDRMPTNLLINLENVYPAVWDRSEHMIRSIVHRCAVYRTKKLHPAMGAKDHGYTLNHRH